MFKFIFYITCVALYLVKVNGLPTLWTFTYDMKNVSQHVVKKWNNHIRGFNLRIYNVEQARRELENTYPLEVVQFFDMASMQSKAQFWSVCMLYRYGGVFIDINTELKRPLMSVFHPEKILITYSNFGGHKNVYFGLFGGPKKHSLFGQLIVTFIDKKLYDSRSPQDIVNHVNQSASIVNPFDIKYLENSVMIHKGCIPSRYGSCNQIYDENKNVIAHSSYIPQSSNSKNITQKPILWMCTIDVNLIPQYAIDTWKKYTTGYQVRIYDRQQTNNFMRKYASQEAYTLFSQLQSIKLEKNRPAPHAYDLWRAHALFLFGGIYLDDKIILKRQLKDIFKPNDITLMRGMKYPDEGIAIGLIGVPRGHTLMSHFIESVVKQGLPFTNYHNYCIKMMEACQSVPQDNITYLQEQNIAEYEMCDTDRYGLCVYVIHPEYGSVARVRPSIDKYPWKAMTNATGLKLVHSGDFYILNE